MQQLARTNSRTHLFCRSSEKVQAKRSRSARSAKNETIMLEMQPGQAVHFEMEAKTVGGKFLPSMTSAVDWLRINESRLRHEVALDLKNRLLLEWNLGSDLDLCKFQESINLHSIFLRSDLSWELYYDDGDIFGGQIVVGETTSEGSLQKVYLAA
jgi:hypothetical protein